MTKHEIQATWPGNFFTPSGAQVYCSDDRATWFVPQDANVPVYVKLKHSKYWGPRGF